MVKQHWLNIISGLIKPSNGFVKIDGINIENDLNGFLSIIGYVSQTPFIFAGSLATNISLKNLKTNDYKKLKKFFIYVVLIAFTEILKNQ